MAERLLVLVRHGESEWNNAGRFAGQSDIDLTATGVAQARAAGQRLKAAGLRFNLGFSSTLKRAWRTLELMLEELGQADIPIIRDARLDERHYGELNGLTRAEAISRWGEAQVHAWRRSYDARPPGGESLKDTAARVQPYYAGVILPRVLNGDRVVVAAHNNSLRALVMALERLDEISIVGRELGTAAPLAFRLNADGTVAERIDLAG